MSTYKATAIAHPNIAFVKYWGKRDYALNIPLNGSISMNLDGASTITTVEFLDQDEDTIFLQGKQISSQSKQGYKISSHLDRVRALSGVVKKATVKSINDFPAASGIASSASGFAALTVAAMAATGKKCSTLELSRIARLGSGSACRSIPSGFTEWLDKANDEESVAIQIAKPEDFKILDIVLVVSSKSKEISSSDGHIAALTSPFMASRLTTLEKRLNVIRSAILNKDFSSFGREVEQESMSMHAVAITSSVTTDNGWFSGVYYWTAETMTLIHQIQIWRTQGLEVYLTLDAGPNVHLLCEEATWMQLQKEVVAFCENSTSEISYFVNRPGIGTMVSSDHLF